MPFVQLISAFDGRFGWGWKCPWVPSRSKLDRGPRGKKAKQAKQAKQAKPVRRGTYEATHSSATDSGTSAVWP